MKLNYSKKILVASIITLLVVVVCNIIFTKMLLDKIASINDKVKQIDFSSQEREKALILKDSVLSSVSERGELDQYFVGSGNIETVKFTKYLEDLALEMDVVQRKTLDYEMAAGTGSSEIVSAIRYKFSISGKWNNVYAFIQAIENLPKVSRVNGISMNYGAIDKKWSADLDFSVVKLK